MIALPQGFIDNMAARLDAQELPAFLAAMDAPYYRGIRLNPMKPCAVLPEGLLAPVPWAKTGHYLSLDSNAGAVPLHEAGAWYLQEPSAMLPAAVLKAQPGERILDLCAAPGGKATQSVLSMAGEGLLVANEPVPKRAAVLARNMERMGIPNSVVVSALPEQLAKRWPGAFDGVQVDAPCSGEGMFRKHPETRNEWQPESPAGCARRQLEILDWAAVLCRKGGRIVYSTCTLNEIENEGVVETFCKQHPEFSLEPFSLPGVDAEGGMFTCWPHRFAGEGHFVALLRKAGEEAPAAYPDRSLPKPDRQQLTACQQFIPEIQPDHVLRDTLVSCPLCPDVKGLKVYRCGLHLGTLKGKVFQPDHALAVASPAPNFPVVDMTEEETERYLRGDVVLVPAGVKGWVLMATHGLVLGWGKASEGMAKNHYPKGLRRG